MIKTNVQELLDKKGKTRYWLVMEMQTTYRTVNNICDNTLIGIQMETLDKLCDALDCTPAEIFSKK